jgi:hypothetical protein
LFLLILGVIEIVVLQSPVLGILIVVTGILLAVGVRRRGMRGSESDATKVQSQSAAADRTLVDISGRRLLVMSSVATVVVVAAVVAGAGPLLLAIVAVVLLSCFALIEYGRIKRKAG